MPIIKLRSKAESEEAVANLELETRNYVKLLGEAPYVQALSYKPHILKNTSMASGHGNPTRLLQRKVKEMIASSICMLNGCHYCITSHTGLLKKVYNVTDEELVELAAVVGHINGLDFLEKAARSELFQLSDEVSHSSFTKKEIMVEISRSFGQDLPKSFLLASKDAELLAILWDREKVTMQEGKTERWVKELIALCVSISNSCYDNARIRFVNLENLQVKTPAILEGLWVAERFSKNAKIIDGLLLEPNPNELDVVGEQKDQL